MALQQQKIKKPFVVLLDIETSPLLGFAWDTFKTNILKIVEPSRIISVAWKELDTDHVYCKSIADYPGYKKDVIDDEKLVKETWKVLDRADVVIAHHGDAFDLKKLNARFVYYGLPMPSAYKSIDTKKVASRQFAFDSNSLNNLGQYLGVGQKINNGGFSLWLDCMAGDKDAWELMKKYNSQDVVLLEKVYLKLRPYQTNHPNLAAIAGENNGLCCPTCQSTSVQKRGFTVTRTGRRQRYACSDCGSWSSGPFERLGNKILSPDED